MPAVSDAARRDDRVSAMDCEPWWRLLAQRGGDQFLWVATDRQRSALLSRAEAVVADGVAVPATRGLDRRSTGATVAVRRGDCRAGPTSKRWTWWVTPAVMIGDAAEFGGLRHLRRSLRCAPIDARRHWRDFSIRRLIVGNAAMSRAPATGGRRRAHGRRCRRQCRRGALRSAGLDVMYLRPVQRREMLATFPGDRGSAHCLPAGSGGAGDREWCAFLELGDVADRRRYGLDDRRRLFSAGAKTAGMATPLVDAERVGHRGPLFRRCDAGPAGDGRRSLARSADGAWPIAGVRWRSATGC